MKLFIVLALFSMTFSVIADSAGQCRYNFNNANTYFNYADYSMDEADLRFEIVEDELASSNPEDQIICGFSDLASTFYKQAMDNYYIAIKFYQKAIIDCSGNQQNQSQQSIVSSNRQIRLANRGLKKTESIYNQFNCTQE